MRSALTLELGCEIRFYSCFVYFVSLLLSCETRDLVKVHKHCLLMFSSPVKITRGSQTTTWTVQT